MLTAAQNGIEKYEFVLVLLTTGWIPESFNYPSVNRAGRCLVFISSRAEEIGLYLFQIRSLQASLGKVSGRS